MKIIREYDLEDSVISTKEPTQNFSKTMLDVCGKTSDEELRTILQINSDKLIKMNNKSLKISKVELCMYLYQITPTENTDYVIIKIGINTSKCDLSNVNFQTAPNFYRQKHGYKIRKEFINRYISFDITNINYIWVQNEFENNGITIEGIEQEGLVCFGSAKSKKRPYLKVFYGTDQDEEGKHKE